MVGLKKRSSRVGAGLNYKKIAWPRVTRITLNMRMFTKSDRYRGTKRYWRIMNNDLIESILRGDLYVRT